MHDDRPGSDSYVDRRQFVALSAGLSAAGLAAFAAGRGALAQEADAAPAPRPIPPRSTILFQGDSITDAGRNRDPLVASKSNDHLALGGGYAWLAAAELMLTRPADGLQIFNRGISGNKVFQLADRWQADCLDLEPDVLSILIGVNDMWHSVNGTYDGTVEKYETDYRALIERTKAALPNVQLVVCEPFVLRTGAVTEAWFPVFDEYRGAARRIAEGAGATFVPFQAMFDAASKIAPPETWARDGVHPSPAGAALMARWWLAAVGP